MKNIFFLFLIPLLITKCAEPMPITYSSIEDYPIYHKTNLGLNYTPNASTFKLWSPAVDAVTLHLYEDDMEGSPTKSYEMALGKRGVWTKKLTGDWNGKYYAFQIKNNGTAGKPTADPYSTACGRNGLRTQIINLKETNPKNWDDDKRPDIGSPTDMIIYELHIRDMSIFRNSGIRNKGKFLGLVENNTKTKEGIATGLSHLKKMGITHVHLLPSFDFRSIDESLPEEKRNYNWGYDPHLFNVPEGTYSTNPRDGRVRIMEFKKMVQALHSANIGVILDVVYNHTGVTENSVFNSLVPNYYYRKNEDGTFSNASGCGNETASERQMVQNFIVQSVKYWATEYHLDGFRFDLMGIHDIETMNRVTDELHKIDPSIFVYGEGWTAGGSPLPDSLRALKHNVPQLKETAAFSDEVRDAIKGHVFTDDAKGFIAGNPDLKESIKFGVVGGTQHPQIDYKKVNYTDFSWSPQPTQCIVYASCHDNHTIWDRLQNSIPDADEIQREKMQQLALGIVLTSQGVPFLHSGSEFCRTKNNIENSYESPDSINQIDWTRVADFPKTVEFVREMIALRKAHPAFRMRTTKEIQNNLQFIDNQCNNILTFTIKGKDVGDSWANIYVTYNGNLSAKNLSLPEGEWKLVVRGNEVDMEGIGDLKKGNISVPGSGMVVLITL